MSDRDKAFQELARRYEEQFQTKVTFELYAPSEVYTQKIKASAQTNTLPDVYGILGEKRDFASFIRSGYVADLSKAVRGPSGQQDSWEKALFDKSLAVNRFTPDNEYGVPAGTYGIPIDVMTIQFLYNKALYAKAGLDPSRPPRTWEEFIAHGRILREQGIPGLVSGFGEVWMIDALASNWAMNCMGEEKVFRTYAGEVPYTDPDWIRVLSLFKTLADEKLIVEGAVSMVNKTAEQVFANDRAAYAFNGSWSVNVYKGMRPDLDFAAFLPPSLSEAHPVRIWGGASASFVVNARSPRQEKAVHFLHWLTQRPQQEYLAGETLSLPSNRESLKSIPEILAQFADDLEHSTHPQVYPVREHPRVVEAFDKGIQLILIGDKTPEEIAREVQHVKEKVAREKRS